MYNAGRYGATYGVKVIELKIKHLHWQQTQWPENNILDEIQF
jgi:ribosomal protein L37AE/L43A